jgi:excisionase family DNA binding protein
MEGTRGASTLLMGPRYVEWTHRRPVAVEHLPDLLTLPEAARLLRVTPAHIRRMINAGLCPAVVVSPRVRRIPSAHVRGLLANAGATLTLSACALA